MKKIEWEKNVLAPNTAWKSKVAVVKKCFIMKKALCTKMPLADFNIIMNSIKAL